MKFIANKLQGAYYGAILRRVGDYYADGLVGLVVYGSFARGEDRLNSDLDIMIIVKDTDKSNPKRIAEFVREIEMPLEDLATDCWKKGVWVDVSPMILTRNEALHFQPIYLDMVDENVVLIDRDGVVKSIFEDTRKRMKRWGSRRRTHANGWYWDIKPSLKKGEIIDYDE